MKKCEKLWKSEKNWQEIKKDVHFLGKNEQKLVRISYIVSRISYVGENQKLKIKVQSHSLKFKSWWFFVVLGASPERFRLADLASATLGTS